MSASFVQIKRRGLSVVSEVLLNRGDEKRDALEGASTNAVARDLAEPPFDEIEPGSAGRNEMKVHPRMTTQPPLFSNPATYLSEGEPDVVTRTQQGYVRVGCDRLRGADF